MKKALQLTFLILLNFASFNIYSQEVYTVFGVRGGAGLSSLRGLDDFGKLQRLPGTDINIHDAYSGKPYFAWDLGLTVQHMRNKLLLQGEVILASYANSKLEDVYINQAKIKRIKLFYNSINILAGTKIPLSETFRLVAAGGPYVGFDVSSWFSERNPRLGKNGDNSNLIFGGTLKAKDADFKESDFGVVVMAGIEIENIQLALNYQHGLVNVVKDTNSLYNRIYKLSMVYFF